MAYESLYDPTNPFATVGLSREVRALLTYLEDAKRHTGLDVVVTCTTDHPASSTYHLRTGTEGRGLAVDCRLRTRGLDIHRAVFDLFRPAERQLAELIYADPPSAPRSDGRFGPYNIKDGRRVPPYSTAGHHDHVHAAVRVGTFLRYPAPAPPPPPTPEEAPLMFIAYIDNGPAYLMLADGTKRLLDASEIAGLKAILPIVVAPKLIAATPDA